MTKAKNKITKEVTPGGYIVQVCIQLLIPMIFGLIAAAFPKWSSFLGWMLLLLTLFQLGAALIIVMFKWYQYTYSRILPVISGLCIGLFIFILYWRILNELTWVSICLGVVYLASTLLGYLERDSVIKTAIPGTNLGRKLYLACYLFLVIAGVVYSISKKFHGGVIVGGILAACGVLINTWCASLINKIFND